MCIQRENYVKMKAEFGIMLLKRRFAIRLYLECDRKKSQGRNARIQAKKMGKRT